MKTHRLGLAGLALLGLVGCQGAYHRGTFDGYAVEYQEASSNAQNIKIYSQEKNGGHILFMDNNYDKRFDEITLEGVRNGDPVEKYASLEMGQRIADSFAEVEEPAIKSLSVPSLNR